MEVLLACGGPGWAKSLIHGWAQSKKATAAENIPSWATLLSEVLACEMPRAMAEVKACLGCRRRVSKSDGRRAYAAQLCQTCWPKHVKQARVVSQLNLEQGRTSQAAAGQSTPCTELRAHASPERSNGECRL